MVAKKKLRKNARSRPASKAGKKTKTTTRRSSVRKKAESRGPGRRLSDAEQKRRLEALNRHGTKTSPEPLTAQRIADKLGINVGTWNVWKSNQKKPRSRRAANGRGRQRKAGSSLDGVVAEFRELERERDQLKNVLESVRRAVAGISIHALAGRP